MTFELKTEQQLREYDEKLKVQYIETGLAFLLEGIYGCFAHGRPNLNVSFETYLDELEQMNGPDRVFLNALFRRSWFSVCSSLDSAERIRIIKSCLEPVDCEKGDLVDGQIDDLLQLLNAEPQLWESCDGYFAIGMVRGEESIVEIRRTETEGKNLRPIVFQSFSDDSLRACLMRSWGFATDQKIAQNARARLMQDVREAWRVHQKDAAEPFDLYPFVTLSASGQSIPEGADIINGMWVWEKLPLVLGFNQTDGILRNGEYERAYFSVPEIWKNTERLRTWLQSVQEKGYPGLSEAQWTLKGIENECDEPLLTSSSWFRPKPSELTLKQALLMGMHQLELDQAFFGDLLITHHSYACSFSASP
jgi:hypothetical protein